MENKVKEEDVSLNILNIGSIVKYGWGGRCRVAAGKLSQLPMQDLVIIRIKVMTGSEVAAS